MKCHHHPEVEATQGCRLCGRPLCGTCTVEIQGVPYCRDCLQTRLESPARPMAPPSPASPSYRSPRAAGWLSCLPGLGLIYLGRYLEAFTAILLFVGAIHLADKTEMGGIFIPIIWIGQLIYAVQEARRMNQAHAASPVVEPEAPPAVPREKESPMWGIILVVIGGLFLLDQFDMLNFGEIFETFWPVLIIVLGLQMIFRSRRQRTPRESS